MYVRTYILTDVPTYMHTCVHLQTNNSSESGVALEPPETLQNNGATIVGCRPELPNLALLQQPAPPSPASRDTLPSPGVAAAPPTTP